MIVGDHLTMSKRFCTGIDRSNRAVYNCIINSAVDTKNTNNREFMILDLFPTTLAALGYTFEGSRLGLGTNLFAQDPTLCELFGTEYLMNNSPCALPSMSAYSYRASSKKSTLPDK